MPRGSSNERYNHGMEREEAAQIFKDVVIYRTRTDVPEDVVNAMDKALLMLGNGEVMDRPWEPGQDIPKQWCNCRPGILREPHEMGLNEIEEVDIARCKYRPAPPERICQCGAFDTAHPVGFDRCGRMWPWRKGQDVR
jgi:hypothetical protein